jgi:hypothetical protein
MGIVPAARARAVGHFSAVHAEGRERACCLRPMVSSNLLAEPDFQWTDLLDEGCARSEAAGNGLGRRAWLSLAL